MLNRYCYTSSCRHYKKFYFPLQFSNYTSKICKWGVWTHVFTVKEYESNQRSY